MKNHTSRMIAKSIVIAIVAGALMSCGGGNKNGGGNGGGGGTTTLQEDKFGVQFGKDFRKDTVTGNPETVNSGDVIEVDPTAEPTNIM